ncbi:DNA-deoxyinosine glycosylase [Desulfopila inferna]|uniref:DNA-deoxyinosine glycosylase n=1 Tax=Desulfopila inferna TaxID=468528 RepID=UPI001962524D|nr:DNA-deoxyinosine glycosylase [Desulfopila inferna]MBM9603713.1 DNA-deoxyinosine glycosylase [Desulfopila inferna]
MNFCPDKMMLHGFPPISGPACHTLILGSMPGRDSLDASQYYAHNRNAFWPIMGEIYGATPSLSYDQRRQTLVDNGISVWDVIKSCRRETSLDSAIEEESIAVNDFENFLADHPLLTRIFFNGAKAEQSFKRYVGHLLCTHGLSYLRLPSTSPANARMNFQQKLLAWSSALK